MSYEALGFHRLSYDKSLDRKKLDIILNHTPARKAVLKRTGFIKDVADVIIDNEPVISVYGLSDYSDEELEMFEVYVWGESPDIKLCIYKPKENEIVPYFNEPKNNKIKNLPNQNYLALRKSRY